MKLRSQISIAIIYLAVFAAAFGAASLGAGAQGEPNNAPADAANAPSPQKAFFSLSTNRTYSTADRVRVWINYGGIDSLDFRVYHVDDPVKFFGGLTNPHKMGEK